MLFDIVIPTLDIERAALAVQSLQTHSRYANNYIIIDNSDSPQGYVKPCNQGARAGESSVVCFVNDDLIMKSYDWDEALLEEAERNTYCFSPWMPEETNMKLNGWFLCLRRDYINVYGWAFDPRFTVWCGDVDLIMRLEQDNIEHVFVKGIDVEHEYSHTTTKPELQQWVVPKELRDLELFEQKWGVSANDAKIRT